MASYRPATEFTIPEPCSANWDDMQGDARSRHCAACSRDVHNLAMMTPREIEALMAGAFSGDAGHHAPCVRMAQFEDGSLMVAPEPRAQMPYGRVAGAVMAAAVVTISTVAAAQQPVLGRTMGKVMPPAVYVGLVVGADGTPAPQASVNLSRMNDGKLEQVHAIADASGHFRLTARAGSWTISATTAGGVAPAAAVTLEAGEHQATQPLQLRPVQVTAGAPVMMGAVAPAVPMGKPLPPPKPTK